MILYYGSSVEIVTVDFLESKVGKGGETYTKILNLRKSLFSQSTAYVYSILETEILTGKLG